LLEWDSTTGLKEQAVQNEPSDPVERADERRKALGEGDVKEKRDGTIGAIAANTASPLASFALMSIGALAFAHCLRPASARRRYRVAPHGSRAVPFTSTI
jgi:hypothetical protein